MRYIFPGVLSILMLLGICALPAPARAVEVEPDLETHRVLGTLYALAAAANLRGAEGGELPTFGQLERYFQKDSLPSGGLGGVRIEAFSGNWWLGVPIGITSTARKFLRAHATKLNVFDEPEGAPWIGSPFVWLKAVRWEGGKKPASFGVSIAEGQNKDKDALFFNVLGTDWHWWSPLRFTTVARALALKRWGRGVENLRVPQEQGMEPESLKASPVGFPKEFSVSSDREPGPSMEMGDVIFNPIPRSRNDTH